jgi:hypothetical protein
MYVYHDPLYKGPLVLATNLVNVHPAAVFRHYQDRWPVKHPLPSAKQMIGFTANMSVRSPVVSVCPS